MLPTIANQSNAAVLEQVLIKGDLAKLNDADRILYYKAVCESVGLNPLTKPFDYIALNGKLVLYAKRDCTDQLRTLRTISVTSLEREIIDDLYVVTAHGKDLTGRMDSAIGAVSITGLKGENKANAMMKAETKAKRRLTLSLAGLGFLDESEADSVPGAVFPMSDQQVQAPPSSSASDISTRHTTEDAATTPAPREAVTPDVVEHRGEVITPPQEKTTPPAEKKPTAQPPAEKATTAAGDSHANKTPQTTALCKALYTAAGKIKVPANGKPLGHDDNAGELYAMVQGLLQLPTTPTSLYDIGTDGDTYRKVLAALNKAAAGGAS